MNRRGFLTSLGALATSAAFPKIPSIPLGGINPIVLFIAHNAIYGKMGPSAYSGGRVYYSAPDGMISEDIMSAYPKGLKFKSESVEFPVRDNWKIT